MPQYLAPGVYVEEVDAGPRPIQGVSTSVTGAVGVTQRGPTEGKPVLVTSFNEYQRIFGGYLRESDNSSIGQWWRFPNAVRGFFENGGQQLYVKRVISSGASPSSAPIKQGLIARILRDVAPSANATANATFDLHIDHAVGIRTEATNGVTVKNGETGADIVSGNVEQITTTNSGTRITIKATLANEIKSSRGDYVSIRATGALAFTANASSPGAWGRAIRVSVRPATTTLPVLRNPNIPFTSGTGKVVTAQADNAGGTWTITVNAGHTLTNGMFVQIASERFKLLEGSSANTFKITRAANASAISLGTDIKSLPMANDIDIDADPSQDLQKLLFVAGASQLYVGGLVEIDNGTTKTFRVITVVNTESVSLDAAPGGAGAVDTRISFAEDDRLHLVELTVDVELASGGTPIVEQFANLKASASAQSANKDDPRLLHNAINRRSSLIRIDEPSYSNALNAIPCGDHPIKLNGFVQLEGGDDAFGSLTDLHFIGEDEGSGKRTGIKSLEDIEDISLVMTPGVFARPVVEELLRHCDFMKYRMALIDSPPQPRDIDEIKSFRNLFDSKRAALYYPWVRSRQPGVTEDVLVPPSGHIAGIYADVDTRRGYHKAPANEILRGITQIDRDVNRREQELLNPVGINALRFFPGRGNRVWGARTISSDSNFKYVNVRRIFNFIERSIDEGTQFVVFEPNDSELWSRVRQTASNFLNTQWRSGALEGKTADEAYFVACDRGTTMTQDDIENGRLIVEVGIAPVFPAEFVIFRIQKFTADSKLA